MACLVFIVILLAIFTEIGYLKELIFIVKNQVVIHSVQVSPYPGKRNSKQDVRLHNE